MRCLKASISGSGAPEGDVKPLNSYRKSDQYSPRLVAGAGALFFAQVLEAADPKAAAEAIVAEIAGAAERSGARDIWALSASDVGYWRSFRAGVEEGAAAERARCEQIIMSEHALGRRKLALHLATQTDVDVDESIATLQAAPLERGNPLDEYLKAPLVSAAPAAAAAKPADAKPAEAKPADAKAAELKKLGIDETHIVAENKNGFSLVLASSQSEATAREQLQEIMKRVYLL
jgi:ribosomal protein L12E/L44/L45/RPP1/RPP2